MVPHVCGLPERPEADLTGLGRVAFQTETLQTEGGGSSRQYALNVPQMEMIAAIEHARRDADKRFGMRWSRI